MSVQEQGDKKCVVYYKTGWLEGNGNICYGHAFDRLDSCCEKFEQCFLRGNKKPASFGSPASLHERGGQGFDLLSRGGEIKLLLCGCEDEVKFCLFCGAKVEVLKSKDVMLLPKTRDVPDGFAEIERIESRLFLG